MFVLEPVGLQQRACWPALLPSSSLVAPRSCWAQPVISGMSSPVQEWTRLNVALSWTSQVWHRAPCFVPPFHVRWHDYIYSLFILLKWSRGFSEYTHLYRTDLDNTRNRKLVWGTFCRKPWFQSEENECKCIFRIHYHMNRFDICVNWVMIPILAALEWPSMWWCASQKHVDTEILSAVTFSPESVASEVKISEEKRGKLIQICVLETSLLALLTFPWRPVWFLLDCFSCCHTTVGEHPPVISQQIWNQTL